MNNKVYKNELKVKYWLTSENISKIKLKEETKKIHIFSAHFNKLRLRQSNNNLYIIVYQFSGEIQQ